MRTIANLVRQDLKTVFNNISWKIVTATVLLFVATYAILGYSSVLSSPIDNPISFFVLTFQLVVPYLGLRAGHSSVSREVSEETHRLLLTMPISRRDIIISKFVSRSILVSVTILFYTLVSVVSSYLFFDPLNLVDVFFVSLANILLAMFFVPIGIAISCTGEFGSIVSQIKMSVTYILIVFIWRFIPVITGIAFTSSSLSSLPDPDYPSWSYALLKINPLESHANIVQTITSADVSFLIPSTLALPDLSEEEIVHYPFTPVTSNDQVLYVQSEVTVLVTLVIPVLFLFYAYYVFNNKDL